MPDTAAARRARAWAGGESPHAESAPPKSAAASARTIWFEMEGMGDYRGPADGWELVERTRSVPIPATESPGRAPGGSASSSCARAIAGQRAHAASAGRARATDLRVVTG